MIPEPVITTVCSATALGASYADLGSAVDIKGCCDVTVHVTMADNVGNGVFKVFIDDNATSAPSASTAMNQLLAAADDGTEREITVLNNESGCFPLNVSGNYLFIQGKYSATSGTATVKITGVPVSAR